MSEVTRILCLIEQGNAQAAEQLLPLVYDELRRLAARKLAGESPGHTLQATALVREAYLRLVDHQQVRQWQSKAHFFSAAAEAMRRILIENARRKRRQNHGGRLHRVPVEEAELAVEAPDDDLLAIHEGLEQLARTDPQTVELVRLRYFAGLTLEQAAESLGITPRTARGLWAFARAWLYRLVGGKGAPSGESFSAEAHLFSAVCGGQRRMYSQQETEGQDHDRYCS